MLTFKKIERKCSLS